MNTLFIVSNILDQINCIRARYFDQKIDQVSDQELKKTGCQYVTGMYKNLMKEIIFHQNDFDFIYKKHLEKFPFFERKYFRYFKSAYYDVTGDLEILHQTETFSIIEKYSNVIIHSVFLNFEEKLKRELDCFSHYVLEESIKIMVCHAFMRYKFLKKNSKYNYFLVHDQLN